MLLNGFLDFLTQFMVVFILIILAAILLIISFIKKKYLVKYHDPEDDIEQTPEEILQDELDSLLVTTKIENLQAKKKKVVDEYEDDDFDYDNQGAEAVVEEKEKEETSFEINDSSSYSMPSFDFNDDDK